jgi:hypothetical protein
MVNANKKYQGLVQEIGSSLLHNMKESSLIKLEDWVDDARDIISMLREKSVRNEEVAKNLIKDFYVNKESEDYFTDFETPSKEVAKIYLQNEYL